MHILRRCRGGRQSPAPEWLTPDREPRLAVVVAQPPAVESGKALRERTDHAQHLQLSLTPHGEVAA